MQVKDYLTEEYKNKCFLLKMKDGTIRWTQVAQDVPDDPLLFYAEYGWDADIIRVKDIDHVIQEVDENLDNGCYCCIEGVVDWNWVIANPDETPVCDKCKVSHEQLERYRTGQSSIYKYDSKDELIELLSLLDDPIVIGDSRSSTGGYQPELTKLDKTYGLVYVYSTWDEYDDDPIQWCGIIDGGIIQE